MTSRFSVPMALLAAAASILQCSARAGEAGDLAGTYCAGIHEVGTCLRLTPDGKFEYFLSYGAYDEASEGTWRRDGGEIVLESPAYDKAPRFTFKGTQPTESGKFEVTAVSNDGHAIQLINVRVTCDGRSIYAGETGTVDFKVDCQEAPKSVSLGFEMYGVGWQTFDVSGQPGAGKGYTFVFDPGDLGKKRFAATHLKVDGDGSLLMTYESPAVREFNGRTFKYRRNE
jgi:hypothetical protein